MALLNTGCLISTVQADLDAVTTGYAAECFVTLAAAVDGATVNRCVTLPVSGCLPSLWPVQTIPEGQIVFLEDINIPLTAGSGVWVGLDKRMFRRDRPPIYECYLYSFGCNNYGQLGDATTTSRSSPVTVAGGGSNWKQISAGGSRGVSAGVKNDGTLWTWGYNGSTGELGNGTQYNYKSSPQTTAGGGTTWCMVSIGSTPYPQNGVGFAIKTDGTLWGWGYNHCGVLGGGTAGGCRLSPASIVAGGGTNWCFVSTNYSATAAIKTDGTLWTWGYNFCGRLGDGTTTNRSSPGTVAGGGTTWRSVNLGIFSTAAIKSDGTLWTWGGNGSGALGDGTAVGRSSPGTTAGGGTNWCIVKYGYGHAAAIKTDGTLWTWGYNACGQLGTGTTSNRSSPGTTVGGGTTWCDVSSMARGTAAIKSDGTFWTWGANGYGSLGDNGSTARSSPGTVVGGFTDWALVATTSRCTGSHTLAIRAIGT